MRDPELINEFQRFGSMTKGLQQRLCPLPTQPQAQVLLSGPSQQSKPGSAYGHFPDELASTSIMPSSTYCTANAARIMPKTRPTTLMPVTPNRSRRGMADRNAARHSP